MALAVSVVLTDKVMSTLSGPSLKSVTLVVLLCLVAVSAGSMLSQEAEATTSPNVLFILTADQNAASFSRMDQIQRRPINGHFADQTITTWPIKR